MVWRSISCSSPHITKWKEPWKSLSFMTYEWKILLNQVKSNQYRALLHYFRAQLDCLKKHILPKSTSIVVFVNYIRALPMKKCCQTRWKASTTEPCCPTSEHRWNGIKMHILQKSTYNQVKGNMKDPHFHDLWVKILSNQVKNNHDIALLHYIRAQLDGMKKHILPKSTSIVVFIKLHQSITYKSRMPYNRGKNSLLQSTC